MEKIGFIKYNSDAPAKTCIECGGVFYSHVYNSLRCSKECKKKYRASFERKRRAKLPQKHRSLNCSICYNLVLIPPSSKVSNICCSENCKKISNKNRAQKQIDNGNIKKSQIKYNQTEKAKARRKRFVKSQKYKNWYKEKSKDINFRLYSVLRSTLNTRIKSKKRIRTSQVCHYTPQELRENIESKFKDGMSWDNYGRLGWHIDHIKPLSLFIFFDKNGNLIEDEIRKCMSLDNLQPLWARENIKKGNKL